MKLLLFDDGRADGWHPFALSRPVTELRFGVLLQRQRLERWAGAGAEGIYSRPWLEHFDEAGAPPVFARDRSGSGRASGEPRLWISSRFVPAPASRFEPPDPAPTLLRCGDAVIGCWLAPGTPDPGPGWLSDPDGADAGEVAGEAVLEGRVLGAPWELVSRAGEQLARDVRALAPAAALRSAGDLPAGVRQIGDGPVYLGEGSVVEPGAVLDARDGPIWLDRDVEVRSGCRLAGPLWAGPESRLLGGSIEVLAAGEMSYLRGEISEVTTLGRVNKAHDGYVGHSYLGRWVNLGAGTITSDLKNNYGPVRVGGPEGDRETGLLKMGCLLGDHVKTAIGTLLATGTAVGTGANLFGGPRTPRWVAPFRWGLEPNAPRHRRDAFLETARVVMERRGVVLGEEGRAWLGDVWDEARRRDRNGG